MVIKMTKKLIAIIITISAVNQLIHHTHLTETKNSNNNNYYKRINHKTAERLMRINRHHAVISMQ